MIGHNGGFVARLRQGGCQTELRCGPQPTRLHVLAVHWGRPKNRAATIPFQIVLLHSHPDKLIDSRRKTMLPWPNACNPIPHSHHCWMQVNKVQRDKEKLTLLEIQPAQSEESSSPSLRLFASIHLGPVEKGELCDAMRAEATCLLTIFHWCNATNYENIQSNYTLLPSVLLM